MSQLSSMLVTESDPVSVIAESYRTLRTAIRHKKVIHSEKGSVLMVASPRAQEGRTTTVSNLAVTYAQDGKTVVVVDCNLRNPTVHELFGCMNHTGLVQYLKSITTIEEVISPTSIPHLDIIAAGGQPSNPSELLGSSHMAELLDKLKLRYDVVLLDSPPTLDFTDALLLAEYSDGVLLIAKSGKTKREWAKQARNQLEMSGARMLGIIFTK
jgi:protein-tyrosine kinase